MSTDRGSGVLSNLFCGCIFSGLVSINLQLERFYRFLLLGTCNFCSLWRLSAVLRVRWSSSKLSSSFVLSNLHTPILCQVLIVLWDRCYRYQCLGQLATWQTGTVDTLSLLREKPGVVFFPLILHWATGVGECNGKWMCASSNHCLCFWWHPAWCPYLSMLRFRQDWHQSFC